VPDLNNSPAGMASCCTSLGERAENALSKKRSLAMGTSLNLKIMTLVTFKISFEGTIWIACAQWIIY